MVAIIERFHPIIVDLNVPSFARWNVADLYQQGFIWQQPEVTVVIGDVGIPSHGLTKGLVPQGQLIRVLLELLAPSGK